MWREETGLVEMLLTYMGECQPFCGWSNWRGVLVEILSLHEEARRRRTSVWCADSSIDAEYEESTGEVEEAQEEEEEQKPEEMKEETDEERRLVLLSGEAASASVVAPIRVECKRKEDELWSAPAANLCFGSEIVMRHAALFVSVSESEERRGEEDVSVKSEATAEGEETEWRTPVEEPSSLQATERYRAARVWSSSSVAVDETVDGDTVCISEACCNTAQSPSRREMTQLCEKALYQSCNLKARLLNDDASVDDDVSNDLRSNSKCDARNANDTDGYGEYNTNQGEGEMHNNRRHQCPYSPKTFYDRESLTVHELVHNSEKPYQCCLCPKAFSHASDRRKHERIHTGEKPFKCSYCTKAFSQGGNLRRHERTHTGEKRFKCSQCTKAFSQRTNLNDHERIHTSEKPYKCSICPKTFLKQCAKAAHERIH